jgi:hypothetical protein
MKHKKEVRKKTIKKEFVWFGLRYGLWVTLGIWIFFTIVEMFTKGNESYYNSLFFQLFSVIWLLAIIFTFVLSIIHLTKYKQKAFAIVALVITSFLLLIALIGFVVGFLGIMTTINNIP